ncbi:MAG: HAMP domain-containing histidine kinase [Planctomycetaceae bacterium]|nr:HAMP domain-containing histidine kinase [Planctomycetaceae bacterium]
MSRFASHDDALLSLLQSVCKPGDRASVADQICRVILRYCSAQSVAVIFPVGPDQVTVCRIEDSETGLRETLTTHRFPLTGFLTESGAEHLAGHDELTVRRTIRLLPKLPAAMIVEEAVGNRPAPTVDVQLFVQLAEALLARATDAPVLFPNAQHLEAMAEFAAGAGHEINNPLGSILGQSQLLLKNCSDIAQRQSLETIGSQAWRIRDMIGQTMLFARPPRPALQEFDLMAVLGEIRNSAVVRYQNDAIQIDVEGPTAVSIRADQSQITTAINELVRNSAEAIRSDSGHGQIHVTVVRQREHDAVEITVRDDGPGVTDPVVRQHLFSPFFSGRQAGRGLGFGLSLAWQIVRMHDGILTAWSTAGETRFQAALPLNATQ